MRAVQSLTHNPVPDHLKHKGIQESRDGHQLFQLERDLLFIDFYVIENPGWGGRAGMGKEECCLGGKTDPVVPLEALPTLPTSADSQHLYS